jgi:6-bladed beta-propeller
MVKKALLLSLLAFSAAQPLLGQSALVSAYRSGKIVLSPDPAFAPGFDWESLVLHFANDMTVAPDGSVFVANNREHVILKFASDGRFLKKFGKKGQGPGDFEFPGELQVLDGRTLIVGEYALNRRINLFDLEGQLIRLMRAENPVYRVAALKGEVIAYRSVTFGQAKATKPESIEYHRAFIKNTVTGHEARVADVAIPVRSLGRGFRLDASVCGQLLIAGTPAGDLLVGDTRKAEVEMFDSTGRKLRTFALRLEPFPVTREYLRRYKDEMIKRMRNGPAASLPSFREIVRNIEEASSDSFVDGHFPLYKELLVDSEGNILVFKTTDCVGECPIMVQVYSPAGEYLAEFELDPGPFKVEIDPRFRNICFTGRGVFGLFPKKDDQDEIIVLMRSSLDRAGAAVNK